MSALIQFDLNIDKEYIPVINDVLRMMAIQIVAQILFVMSSKTKEKFFNEVFVQTLFFIVIGVLAYWLIIRKLIVFQ
jgi:hypothetical protein